MQETQVLFLGQENPLQEGMATPSSIIAWEIPWAEEPGRLQSMGLQRVRHDLATTTTTTILVYTVRCGFNLILFPNEYPIVMTLFVKSSSLDLDLKFRLYYILNCFIYLDVFLVFLFCSSGFLSMYLPILHCFNF